MSLATITIEQQGPSKWLAWVEAGYPNCKRQQVIAVTLPSLMIAIHRAYSDVVPEQQAGLKLESDDLWPSAAPKRKRTLSDEAKANMAEGRRRYWAERAALRAMDEGEIAEHARRFTRDEMHDDEPARTDD